MATDQIHAVSVAHGLLAIGARSGAAQVLFHATLIAQRDAEAGAPYWSPWGPLLRDHRSGAPGPVGRGRSGGAA